MPNKSKIGLDLTVFAILCVMLGVFISFNVAPNPIIKVVGVMGFIVGIIVMLIVFWVDLTQYKEQLKKNETYAKENI